jgi:hypothetical protein
MSNSNRKMDILGPAIAELSSRTRDLIEEYQNLPADECALPDFTLPAECFVEDNDQTALDVLLMLLNPRLGVATVMSTQFGISIMGQLRREKTMVLVDTRLFRTIQISKEDLIEIQRHYDRQQGSSGADEGLPVDTIIDENTPPKPVLTLIDAFPSATTMKTVKSYCTTVNDEVRRLREEVCVLYYTILYIII